MWLVTTCTICLRACWIFELPKALVASVCVCATQYCELVLPKQQEHPCTGMSNTTNPPTKKSQQAGGTAPDFLAVPMKLQKSGGWDAGRSILYLLRCIWMPERIADGRSNKKNPQNNRFSHKASESDHPIEQNHSCLRDLGFGPADPEILIVDLPVL